MFTEPLAVALRATLRSGVASGERVLVVSAGTIGRLAAAIMLDLQDVDVAVAEPDPVRRARAEAGARPAHTGDRARLVTVGLTGLPGVPVDIDILPGDDDRDRAESDGGTSTGKEPAGMYETEAVFGFNYDGSWGASGLDVWQHHDHGRMSVELARGKRYFPEWNTARWWLSHEAFQLDPERFLANFDAGLALFDTHGIRVMPVLFNRWRDPTCDFGGVPLDHLLPWASAWTRADDLFADAHGEGRTLTPVELTFRRYVDDVVGSHADDDRIYAWDLCNEPLMGGYVDDAESPLRKAELTWLRWVADRTRAAGARQPLTVGNYASLTAVRLTEPFTDIISFHPYFMWSGDNPLSHMTTKEGFEQFVDATTEFAREAGKGLLASETVWGARDHDTHAEVTRYTLGVLAARGIGFTVHALHHSLIADLHRDEYGPVGNAQWMHFIDPDGTLRPGHEVFNAFAPSRREAVRR